MSSGSANASADVVVAYGGFLGMGSEMLRVPISELSYDYSNDRIVLNVSQQELRSLTSSSSSSSGSTSGSSGSSTRSSTGSSTGSSSNGSSSTGSSTGAEKD